MVDHGETLQARTLKAKAARPGDEERLVPVLTIAFHADFSRIGEEVVLEGKAGERVGISRLEPLFAARGGSPKPLGDPYLSRSPIALELAPDGGVIVDNAPGAELSVDGTAVAGRLALSPAELARGVVLEIADRVVLLLQLGPASRERAGEANALGMIGQTPALAALRRDILRVADLDIPVLIRGETGAGKELVAEALHAASPRRGRSRWVGINMAAIPASTAAAELFGYTRGAFTGAQSDSPGYFGRAHAGTLFMDEIGVAPPDVQVMLLRVLETGELQAVGATRPKPVDVRVIAATDEDLEQAVREGRFREPLLHRLARFVIQVPPLRQRRADIPLLFLHFLRESLASFGERDRVDPRPIAEDPWLPASLMAKLVRHDWPGNVRQLRNFAEQVAIANRGEARFRLSPAAEAGLEAEATRAAAPAGAPSGPELAAAAPRKARRRASEIPEEEWMAALDLHRWQVRPAADELGIAHNTLYKLMRESDKVRNAKDLDKGELEAEIAASGGDVDAMCRKLRVSKLALQKRLKALGLS